MVKHKLYWYTKKCKHTNSYDTLNQHDLHWMPIVQHNRNPTLLTNNIKHYRTQSLTLNTWTKCMLTHLEDVIYNNRTYN